MPRTAPKKTGIAEYKHSTRKKYLIHDATKKEWAQIQKKNLPAFRDLEFPEWPVDRILDERKAESDENCKEYLVRWVEHPIKKLGWRLQWIRGEDVFPAAIEEWEAEKKQDHKQSKQPDKEHTEGPPLSPSRPRSNVTRTLPNSSSEVDSTKDSVQTQNGLNQHFDHEEVSSSIEIPETQPSIYLRAGISVDVPPLPADLDDYESLHSSQLRPSSIGIQESSPLQPQSKSNRPSPVGSHTSPSSRRANRSQVSPVSQITTPNRLAARLVRFRNHQHNTPQVISTSPNVGQIVNSQVDLPSNPPQPLTRNISSSPRSANSPLAPEYVPSTLPDTQTIEKDSQGPQTITQYRDQPSPPWGSQTLGAPHTAPVVSGQGQVVDNTSPGKVPDKASPSAAHSDSSYHSIAQTPPLDSPLFCSPDATRPQTSSSYSSLEAGGIVDSVESEHPQSSDAMDIDSIAPRLEPVEPAIGPSVGPQATIYDASLGGSALPIQHSIEEEEESSNVEPTSSNSKGSSSQQSVENEREIPQDSGLVQPSLPILGRSEYALALPCEGKVQSTYADIVKAKDKAIRKFLSRHESIGSANGSPHRTHERNEMSDMIQLLHDTVTHMDLGLPGFNTQYSIDSQEHAVYANYAGSKFSFLGHLVDMLKHVGLSIVVVSREGQIQDLLEQYLKMKHVVVKRQDRLARSKSPATDRVDTDFQVILVGSGTTYSLDIRSKPCLMIAFDASFDAQDPQVARIRALAERPPNLMPVLHLLVANSSEHVDRCLSKNLPSPVRLKALVRYTYQALPNLGGKLQYVKRETDVPEGRPMDFSDLQRGLRKSPERKLSILANMVVQAAVAPVFRDSWTLGGMPALELTQVNESPSKYTSRTTTRPETPRDVAARSRTPLSRAGTPSGRKRLLDIDGMLPELTKRQRLTPLQDSVVAKDVSSEPSGQHEHLQELVKKLQAELATEKEARQNAEQARDYVHDQLKGWQRDHAGLQRRYEKRMTKCHELDREKNKMMKAMEVNKQKQEKILEENTALKSALKDREKDILTLREEIKAGGGDAAALEIARDEARSFSTKNLLLEKSLENTRKDFEFTRSQYQNASNRATELAGQVGELEKQNVVLGKQASDEKRRLRELNFENATNRHLATIEHMEMERKARDSLLRKIEEENRQLKRTRGVQTRGSSVQPPGSPGLDEPIRRGTRSRQGSPAPGLLPVPHNRTAAERGSLLRNER